MSNGKFCLVICAVLCFWSVSPDAQGVFAPVKDAKWTYVMSVSDYTGLNDTYNNYHLTTKLSYTKDTLVKGRNYKLINYYQEQTGVIISPVIDTKTGKEIGKDTSPYSHISNFSWMVRPSNDSLLSLFNTDTIERLYFVYTARRDTILLKHFFHNNFPDSGRVFIDSVGSYQAGGKNFKAWKGRSFGINGGDIIAYGTQNLTFLDRVGPVDDTPFYGGFNGFIPYPVRSAPLGLVCYEDTEVGLIKFLDLNCNMPFIVETQDFASNPSAGAVNVYFAPASQQIVIDSKELDLTGWEATLVNLNGQSLGKKTLNGTFNQIGAPDRAARGVYLMYLTNKTSGARLTKKVFIYF